MSKTRVRLAIREHFGVVAQVAEALEVSRQTIYTYLDKYELWGELERDRARLLTLAENNVISAIETGDVDTSKWVLARLGKHLGYSDKLEIEGAMLTLPPDVIEELESEGVDMAEFTRHIIAMVRARKAQKQG